MIRIISVVVLLTAMLPAYAQVRINTLIIKPKQVYELKGTDILVVDTLILMDSAILVLNKLKTENFIHARKVVFYRHSMIDGKGVRGLPGRNGRRGVSPSSPCTNGGNGTPGTEGTNGGNGISLYFAFNDIVIHGTPTIDVSGGDAGDGGRGGVGGGGGQGTRLCAGGNGGAGGPGSKGGNGGNGGTVTFQANSIPELRAMLGERIIVNNFGGNPGNGGEGGSGGDAGLSATGKNSLDGKPGRKGNRGADGVAGKIGAIKFVNR
ncbi:MAG: hypothetical protein JNL40_11900 [Cyclobacteriaceae bacterium]|nr:hypothetical protein [Cyclobacteriaceae bacterium]